MPERERPLVGRTGGPMAAHVMLLERHPAFRGGPGVRLVRVGEH